ncbi:MAG: bifunctional DNA primase/polymerase, partial [Chloroflexi bacterium]|nr:bifunctional DNA primase/polymerase [Chloroflexota bacterium]
MTLSSPLAAAREYLAAGLAPIPLPYGAKAPAPGFSWRHWQDCPPGEAELALLFTADQQNVAIVCGRASGNLLVLDADDAPTAHQIGARLEAAGIATWMVRRPPNGTAHDGGGQYWLRTPRPARSGCLAMLAGQAVALDLKGQGSYVVAPPSRHPGGSCYAFASRPSAIFTLPSLDALDWLPLEPARPTAALPRPRISRRAWRLLQGDPATVGQYPSRSEAEAALCAALANAGCTFADTLRLLRVHPGPGKFAARHASDPREALRYLYRTWCHAQEWAATHEAPARRQA